MKVTLFPFNIAAVYSRPSLSTGDIGLPLFGLEGTGAMTELS